MAQIKVFDLDSSCLLSELNQKEARAMNGGFVRVYIACVNTPPNARPILYGTRTCLEVAWDAGNRVLKNTGDQRLAATASLSTPA